MWNIWLSGSFNSNFSALRRWLPSKIGKLRALQINLSLSLGSEKNSDVLRSLKERLSGKRTP